MTQLKEGLIGGGLNLYFIYKFLRILTTPWEKSEAFKLGIVDDDGKILKKKRTLKTVEEKEAYTMMHRLVWKLKRLMEKIPFGKSRLASYAAALWLIKEEKSFYGNDEELQESFLTFLETDWKNNALILREKYEGDMDKKTFRTLRKEGIDIEKSSMKDVIKDFQSSDAPQFKGKSDKKKKEMAIAAKLSKEEVEMDEKNNDVEDEWKNTRIQAKNIFKMLKQKHKNDIPRMKSGLELILKQNKTKPDQEKIMWQEFNKYFKIKEEVEIDEKKSATGYELYHKTFSGAMQHAYDYAKKKGHIVDPKEIDDKVATGPRKPSSGKTNRYSLKAGRKTVEIQVANLDNKRYELNMYIEGVELDEKWKEGTYTITDVKTGKVLGKFKSGAKAQKAADDIFQKGDYDAVSVKVDEEVVYTRGVEIDEGSSDTADMYALMVKGLKAMPSSPKQKEIIKQINVIRKRSLKK